MEGAAASVETAAVEELEVVPADREATAGTGAMQAMEAMRVLRQPTLGLRDHLVLVVRVALVSQLDLTEK